MKRLQTSFDVIDQKERFHVDNRRNNMLANSEPLQQLMDLIEIPVLVQEKVNAALEELQEQEMITSVHKLLDPVTASAEAKWLSQLYKEESM